MVSWNCYFFVTDLLTFRFLTPKGNCELVLCQAIPIGIGQ